MYPYIRGSFIHRSLFVIGTITCIPISVVHSLQQRSTLPLVAGATIYFGVLISGVVFFIFRNAAGLKYPD